MDPYRQYPPYQQGPPQPPRPGYAPPPHMPYPPPGSNPYPGQPRPPAMGMASPQMYPGMVPGYPQVPPHMGQQIPPPHQGYYSRPPPQHQRPPPPHMQAAQTGVPPQFAPPPHPGAHLRGGRPPQPFSPYPNGAPPTSSMPGALPARPPAVPTVPTVPTTIATSVNSPSAMTPTKSAAGGVLPDKLNTVFIGSIAPGINNVVMEKLLKTTGNLTKWKRVQDPTTGKWKAFGFAEYPDADSLLRTLRVLGREGHPDKPGPLELKAMDGSDVTKQLLVKVDEKTRLFLDQYEASRTWTMHDTQKDKLAEKTVAKIIEQMNDGTLDTSEPEPESSTTAAEETVDGNKADAKETAPVEKSAVKKSEEKSASDEAIERELNFFRERAAIKEKERREEEERQERLRLRHHQRHGGSASGGGGGSSSSSSIGGDRDRDRASSSSASGRDHHHHHHHHRGGHEEGGSSRGRGTSFPASGSNHVELGSSSKHDSHAGGHESVEQVDSEEEAERQRLERERELEEDYKDRVRRWEQREQDRARIYDKDRLREEEYVKEIQAMKEQMGRHYAKWDDQLERERRHDDYYRDRSRWWQRRQAFLQKEERYDELDREEEAAEIKKAEAAARHAREKEMADSVSAQSLPATEPPTTTTPPPPPPPPTTITPATAEASTEETLVPQINGDNIPEPTGATTLPSQTTKLKLSLGSGIKRSLESGSGGSGSAGSSTPLSSSGVFGNAADFEAEDEGEQAAAKKRRMLEPLAHSDGEQEDKKKKGAEDSKAAPKEKVLPAWKTNAADPAETEKAKAAVMEAKIKALIESLPSDAQGLWKWPIQWRMLDEDKAILEKIRAFAAKKVFELLGVQEDELTNFVMDHIKQRKPPQELAEELRAALDNDAEVLVMKTWRMLVFETEAKARGYTA